MDLIKLVGSIDENFYQLGLKDKQTGKLVHKDVKRMLSTPWHGANLVIEEAAKIVIKNSLLKKSDSYTHLKAYSEGMNISIEECVYVMIIPELVSAMTKWAPGFVAGNLGCSSFITRNELGEVIHGRILDFPLQGSFDSFERAIAYDLNGIPKSLGFSSSGIPYPSITLMTEKGMTLALHQKFTNTFNPKGLPIFEFIFKLIRNVDDKKTLIEFIKAHETITTWCLYVTFSNGDVVAADCFGSKSFINETVVPDQGFLYFCNYLEDPQLEQSKILPLGFSYYNNMRKQSALSKCLSFSKKTKKNITELELLKLMSTPLKQSNELIHFKNFNLDNLTPSSISVMAMNATAGRALVTSGQAPKCFRDEVFCIKDSFNRPIIEKVKVKPKDIVDQDYFYGLHALMEAQKGFDLKNSVNVYHQLQMAIDYLEIYPEKHLAHFYFLVAQYIFETHQIVLGHVLDDFKKMRDHLPYYLKQHCIMFISRLEKILSLPPSTEEDLISIQNLRKVYTMEQKIPRLIFHLTTKNLIIPRIDILDIIYLNTQTA